MIACARHLAWGYVDHPPFSVGALWLVLASLGDSLFAIRLLPALAGGALVFLTGLIARELGGNRFAQGLAALAVIAVPTNLALSHIYSLNIYEPLCWMGCAWLLVRILNGGSSRLWIWFGVLAGVGLENKHTMLLFGFGIAAGLLFEREWRLLRDPWLWLGAAVAGLLFLPNLLWEVRNHWPQLEFMRRADAVKNYHASPLEFFAGQVLATGPILLPLWLGGLVWLFSPAARRWRVLGWCYLVLFVVLVFTHGKTYYLSPAYPMLLAAGATAFECMIDRRHWNWLKPASVAAIIVFSLVSAPFAIPVLPVRAFIRYANAIGFSEIKSENHQMSQLPQFYADMFGWENMAEQVAEVYHRLTPEEQSKAAIFGQDYGQAGAIDYFGPRWGLPHAIGGHNTYYLWGPDDRGEVLIVIGSDGTGAGKIYADVRPAGKIVDPLAMPYESNQTIWVCRRPRVSLREIWPKLKHYS
jgi:4-amino-4-deoxy-L-arabinose transferase-like glycosyltransferase